jgi:hypothetical protein
MKNAITRLTISLFVLGTTLPVFGAQLDVRAFIDGRSDLVIQGNNVWWQNLDGAEPESASVLSRAGVLPRTSLSARN